MSKPFTPQVIVGEAIAGESQKVRTQLEGLINSVNKSAFDIGELLYEVRSKQYYVGWGFSTFKEYIQSLQLKERKSQYLTRMVGIMNQVGIPRATYEPLGVAKLREITSLDPDLNWKNPETGIETPITEFIKGFVEHGNSMDLETLKKNVRILKGQTGDNDLVCEYLWMTRSASDNVWKPAVDLAKALIGSVKKDDEGISQDASDGAAAEMIAVSFLNDPANDLESLLEAEENNELQSTT